MNKIIDQAVADAFKSYSPNARKKLMNLRALIFEVAAQDKNIGELEECLKWGEPAYLAKHGSAVRINWKASSPTQFFIYFNCKTKLAETFKELYGDSFTYKGNRALEFNMADEIPLVPLKHLPLLGA